MECENFVMISSLIKITDAPLTYSTVRSVYSAEERFQQTLKTIASVRQNIPNCVVLIVDCSDFTKDEEDILKTHCDYLLNLYSHEDLRNVLRYSNSKSLCESLQTIQAIAFLKINNIRFKNFFKITGRYTLNEEFDFKLYDNDMNVGRIQIDMPSYFITSLYKLIPITVDNLFEAFRQPIYIHLFEKGVAYEEIFHYFMKSQKNVIFLDIPLGIDELISVNGQHRKQ